MIDTLVWLAAFASKQSFLLVFILMFGVVGTGLLCIAWPARAGRRRDLASVLVLGDPDEILAAARVREGLPRATVQPRRRPSLHGLAARALLLLLVLAGAVVLLDQIGVPGTRRYISEHGATAPARIDGGWVTFTAQDGRTYTLEIPPMARVTYPGDASFTGSSEESATVRYLPSHPQAYIIEDPVDEA